MGLVLVRVRIRIRIRVKVSVRIRVRIRVRVRRRLRVRLRLGGGVGGSVLVAASDSVHSTFIELRLLIIPQHHIHVPPRPLLFRRYKPTKNGLRGA